MIQLGAWWLLFPLSMAQSSDTSTDDTTPTTATDSSTATPSASPGDSTCTFLTGNSCKQGTCNFCARCIQQSCILANNTGLSTGSRDTCSGKSRSTWYDYCVSNEYDSNGGRVSVFVLITDKIRDEWWAIPLKKTSTTTQLSWIKKEKKTKFESNGDTNSYKIVKWGNRIQPTPAIWDKKKRENRWNISKA